MRKPAFLLFVLVCLVVLGVASSTEVRAQDTAPCCEGGAIPFKKCQTDDDCPGLCVGGARDGKPCGRAGCPSACVGGADVGKRCAADDDCRPACVGGSRDGQLCDPSGNPACPGGECANAGSCGNVGQCADGTCTGQCRVRSKNKQPDNPASVWLDLPVSLLSVGDGDGIAGTTDPQEATCDPSDEAVGEPASDTGS